MKYYFEKRDGKIVSSFPSLPDWFYTIQETKKNRSLDQNRMYWGYILTYIVKQYEEAGETLTKTYLHETMKLLIPRKRVKSDFTKWYVFKKWSTTDLNTKQFKEYIDKIKALCEFWELHQLKLPYIKPFVIPEINEEDLLYWESLIS